MSGMRWEEISEAAKDLVSQLFLVDSRSRMSAEDVLHGFSDDKATVTQYWKWGWTMARGAIREWSWRTGC